MGLFRVKIKMIGVILASAKMLYTGNDAEWCSWMCRALLSEYICRNSAAFCKMEALGFAGGDAWPRAQRGAKPQAGERGAFWYSYPFCVLGAEFVFRDGAKRKGKDSSLSVLLLKWLLLPKHRDAGLGERGPAAPAQRISARTAARAPSRDARKENVTASRQPFPSNIMLFVFFTYINISVRQQQSVSFHQSGERYLK